MAAARIVKAIDLLEDGHLGRASCLPRMPPDQFGFDYFEESLNGSIIVAIAFARLRYLESVLVQNLLIIMRTVLRPAIRVLDAAFGRLSERFGHPQSSDSSVAFLAVAHGLTGHTPRMQVQDHGQMQPALTRPDIADVACPFLLGPISVEVTI